jgi:hypothetical protein
MLEHQGLLCSLRMRFSIFVLFVTLIAACSSSPPKHPPATITIGKKATPAAAAPQPVKKPKEKMTVYGVVQERCRIADRAGSGLKVKLLADDEPIASDTSQPDGTFFIEAPYDSAPSYDLEIDSARAHLSGKNREYRVELLRPCSDPGGRVGYEPPLALKVLPPQKAPPRRPTRLYSGGAHEGGDKIERIPADRAAEGER